MEDRSDDLHQKAGQPYTMAGLYGKIIAAIEKGDVAEVREATNAWHAADLADLINKISSDKRCDLINALRGNFDPEILVDLDQDVCEEIIDVLGIEDSTKAIENLETDEALDVIESLDEGHRLEILNTVGDNTRQELEEGLSYPEDSAGRMADKSYISIPEFWSVGQTIDYLRSQKNISEDFYEIYVTDPKFKPVGGVLLSRMMRAKRPVLMKDIMDENFTTITADTDQEDVAHIFKKYGLASAPVVNDKGHLIGVINVDDVVNVVQEEADEDILRLAGVQSADLYSDFGATLKKRFPWLAINLVTAVLASIVIAVFEGTIAKIASLAVLMPIVASMGGNAGMQTLTVVVRAIATRDLTATNAARVIGKELVVGVLNGISFAMITGLIAYLWYGDLYMSLALGFAMIATLLIAGLVGTLIPLALLKLKVDPAIASAVVLTTVTDIVAFAVFLGFAAVILL